MCAFYQKREFPNFWFLYCLTLVWIVFLFIFTPDSDRGVSGGGGGGCFWVPPIKSWITWKPFNLWPPNLATFPKIHLRWIIDSKLIKFCITIVFDLPWDDCNTQEKLETKVMQNFGGWTLCILLYVKIAKCEFNFQACNFFCGSGTVSSSGTSFYAKWRARKASNTRVTDDKMYGKTRKKKKKNKRHDFYSPPSFTPKILLRERRMGTRLGQRFFSLKWLHWIFYWPEPPNF